MRGPNQPHTLPSQALSKAGTKGNLLNVQKTQAEGPGLPTDPWGP